MVNRGVALGKAQRYDDALADLDCAIALREGALRNRGDWATRHTVAFACLKAADILRTALRFKESTRRAERAYELWRKLVEDEGHTELENFQVQAMTAVGMVHAEIR